MDTSLHRNYFSNTRPRGPNMSILTLTYFHSHPSLLLPLPFYQSCVLSYYNFSYVPYMKTHLHKLTGKTDEDRAGTRDVTIWDVKMGIEVLTVAAIVWQVDRIYNHAGIVTSQKASSLRSTKACLRREWDNLLVHSHRRSQMDLLSRACRNAWQ